MNNSRLKQFQVPDEIAVRVRQEDMRAAVMGLFRYAGLSEDDTVQAADVLLYADLHGIESHGVSNMMPVYMRMFEDGSINPKPHLKVVAEAAAVATLDADQGLGLVLGPQAMQMAIEKAGKYGIGAVTVINTGHLGAVGYHARMALKHDMIGLAMTTGGLKLVPTFSAKPMVGLNPLAVAVPAGEEVPFIFDGTMSSVAGNKIAIAKRLEEKVLPGWISEADGTPIMEEKEIPDDWMLLPLGGTREIGSHKGYSLAVMIEILCSLLGLEGGGPFRRGEFSHHFIVYQTEAFGASDKFKEEMDRYLKALRTSPPAPGFDRVLYAGMQAQEMAEQRKANGIPYHPEVLKWFRNALSNNDLKCRF